MDQLDLFPYPLASDVLTLSGAFALLWELHLKNLPSGQTFMSMRRAWCVYAGHLPFSLITSINVQNFRYRRLNGIGCAPVGIGTVFHDHTLMSILYNKFREFQKMKLVHNGFAFANVKIPAENPTIGVHKQKPPKRKRMVTPNEFSLLIEHSDSDLADLLIFLMDTGARLNDALKMRPKNYNPFTDCVEWVQSKTGQENSIPPSLRVRRLFMTASRKEKDFVFVSKNLRKRFEDARGRARIRDVQLGRDFRKTIYNVARKLTQGGDIPRQIMGHSSNRTGDDFYYIESRDALRPVIKKVAKIFSL